MNVCEDITIKTNIKQNYKKYVHSDLNIIHNSNNRENN